MHVTAKGYTSRRSDELGCKKVFDCKQFETAP